MAQPKPRFTALTGHFLMAETETVESAIGARALLKHLREAMAESLGPQERLDRIVRHIAAQMRADVCSVYVLRADDVLELFATHGLNAEAVHNSQLKVGQGLVGKIAKRGRILNLADAPRHPAFAYLPEVGEDAYHAFLGVPMRRGGRAMGVLVVQRESRTPYPPEEVEALETAAMVLSDLVASGDLAELTSAGADLDMSRPLSLKGLGLSPGIGIGRAVLHDPRVKVTRLFNDDAARERERLARAIQEVRDSFDALMDDDKIGDRGAHIDVLESLRMFANDRGWVRRINEAIDDGLTAEAATEKVAQDNRARLSRASTPYLRERLEDLDDLARRLLRHLIGETQSPEHDEPIVLVARTMSAAELFDYDREKLVGLLVEEATATGHAVIVARALNIAVVRARDCVARCENGDSLIIDGDEGAVHVRPLEDVSNSYHERLDFLAERVAHLDSLKKLPAETKDGTSVKLLLNGGLDADMAQLEQTGAEGIGLFRTELQFMISNSLPRLDEQARFYKGILDAAGNKPVTFRTLDIGGDKILPYLRTHHEDNPALGWRALRLSIDRPGLLRMQFRALLKAAAGRDLRVKLPMVTVVEEIDQARALLDKEIRGQERFGHPLPRTIRLGAMIEVPGLLWQLDELMHRIDFVSVGSNDLFQFITASDRTNSGLANRYDPLSRPFLRVLRRIARAAGKHETPFHLCGELAGDPLSALALLGIGYRTISMAPGSIGPVKEMVRSLDLGEVAAVMEGALGDLEPRQTISEILSDYANRHGVIVHAPLAQGEAQSAAAQGGKAQVGKAQTGKTQTGAAQAGAAQAGAAQAGARGKSEK